MSEDTLLIIQKAINDDKQVYGRKVTLKSLRAHKVKHIYLAANIDKEAEEDISYYAQLSNVPVEKLTLSAEDLSIVCKRPHHISVLSITN